MVGWSVGWMDGLMGELTDQGWIYAWTGGWDCVFFISHVFIVSLYMLRLGGPRACLNTVVAIG